jgi:hypothetical protein
MDGAISPAPLRKNIKNGDGLPSLLFCLLTLTSFFLCNQEGQWPSRHPLKNKQTGCGHLPIPLRKNIENGGGQGSIVRMEVVISPALTEE